MSKARKLSITQEVKQLKLLKNAQKLGRGSSRMVFIDPRNSAKVVKLAVGANAFCQNKLEVGLWNGTESCNLAPISEYGRFLVVMDRVEEAREDEYDLNAEECEVYEWLCKYCGDTPDNAQLGTIDGKVVAYDYGFDAERDSSKQIGCAWTVSKRANLHQFIDNAIELLRKKRPITEIAHAINAA